MENKKLDRLLVRTGNLHHAVAKLISEATPYAESRFFVAFQCGLLSIEHALGAHTLVRLEIHSPGFSLYRPQFESLVRGIWLLHAAPDNWVEKLSQPLTIDNAAIADRAPMLKEMLAQLDKSEAPDQLVQQLVEFRDVTWKALNSFAHGGLHPISRTIDGYPPSLAFDVILNSNALVAIALQLITIASSESHGMEAVRGIHIDFEDCFRLQ